MVPVHRKGNRQILKTTDQYGYFLLLVRSLKDYCTTWCLSFSYVNNLISKNQLGFRPGDSCINQLLSIIQDIYQSFDDGLEVGAVFLDMSKAFNEVWHKGHIFR